MFYIRSDGYEGRAARIYREPEEIMSDISSIKSRISDVGERINFRSMLDGLMSGCAYGEEQRWLVGLSELISEAGETVAKLSELNESLSMLCDELDEARRVLGCV